VQRLVDRLQKRSVESRPVHAPPGYALGTARLTRCGPEFNDDDFVDSVAVSRVAFDGRDSALVYVEFAGGAYAYYAQRSGARWVIDWHVELWACG
jgi:hypothetical protein